MTSGSSRLMTLARAREPPLVALERERAAAIARFGARGDIGRRVRLSRREQVIAGESRTRQEGFDAAVAAARAARARHFFGRRPRQRIVAPFAADRVGAL